MHSTADRKTWTSGAAPVAPRLELRHDRTAGTILDGAWWPSSRATVTELTNLITALDAQHLPVTRIMLNAEAWDEHPRRIGVAGRTVRLGWFTTLQTSLLIGITGSDQRVDLLVVPPDESAASAAAAMTMATGDDTRTLRAEAIMTAVSTPAPQARRSAPRAEAVWESEGGRVNGHHAGSSNGHHAGRST